MKIDIESIFERGSEVTVEVNTSYAPGPADTHLTLSIKNFSTGDLASIKLDYIAAYNLHRAIEDAVGNLRGVTSDDLKSK